MSPSPSHKDDQKQRRPTPVGIDLGTTNSLIAYLDASGRPMSIPNALGEVLTPSAVLFDDDEVVVGRPAIKAAIMAADRFADCFKRDMGRDAYHRTIRGQAVPPEVLSAFVLAQLKRDAERKIGPIEQAVITVPAFFDELRRKATQDAGRLAGLEVLDIINEPTAAALAYGYEQSFLGPDQAGFQGKPRRVLVYDLGGGTFDVTILEIEGRRFRALATDGDVRLGGRDFDDRLVQDVAEQFRQVHGLDPRGNPDDAIQLWLEVQDCKHAISQMSKTSLVCNFGGLRARQEVTREQFAELTRDLLDRTQTTTTLVLREAGLDWSQVDDVLLVGGASRMPMVQEMLLRVTGKTPTAVASPDEAVAHGAALYAATLAREHGDGPTPACELINVNSHSLGVVGIDTRTRRRVAKVVIPKNTPLPTRVEQTFVTDRDDQRNVRVPIVEGESRIPDECTSLGECTVRDLPTGLAKGTKVKVELSYAANGRISVSARVARTRQTAHVELDRHQARRLGDLNAWSSRLRDVETGSAVIVEQADQEPEADRSDHGSIVRRLDFVWRSVGRAAAGQKLPKSIARSAQSLYDADQQLQVLERQLLDYQQRRKRAADATEAMRLDSMLATIRTSHEQQKRLADFARLVLGRDCLAAGFIPEGCLGLKDEADELGKALPR